MHYVYFIYTNSYCMYQGEPGHVIRHSTEGCSRRLANKTLYNLQFCEQTYGKTQH